MLEVPKLFTTAAALAIICPYIELYSIKISFFITAIFLFLTGIFKHNREMWERREQERKKVLRKINILSSLNDPLLAPNSAVAKKHRLKQNYNWRFNLTKSSYSRLISTLPPKDYEAHLYKVIKAIENQPNTSENKRPERTESSRNFVKVCLSLLDYIGVMKIEEAKRNETPKSTIKAMEKEHEEESRKRRAMYIDCLESNHKISENNSNSIIQTLNSARSKIWNLFSPKKYDDQQNEKILKEENVITTKDNPEKEEKLKVDDEVEFLKLFDEWILNGRKEKNFLLMLDNKRCTKEIRKPHYSMFLIAFFDSVMRNKKFHLSEKDKERLTLDFCKFLDCEENNNLISSEEKHELEERFYFMLSEKNKHASRDTRKDSIHVSRLFKECLELLDKINKAENETKNHDEKSLIGTSLSDEESDENKAMNNNKEFKVKKQEKNNERVSMSKPTFETSKQLTTNKSIFGGIFSWLFSNTKEVSAEKHKVAKEPQTLRNLYEIRKQEEAKKNYNVIKKGALAYLDLEYCDSVSSKRSNSSIYHPPRNGTGDCPNMDFNNFKNDYGIENNKDVRRRNVVNNRDKCKMSELWKTMSIIAQQEIELNSE